MKVKQQPNKKNNACSFSNALHHLVIYCFKNWPGQGNNPSSFLKFFTKGNTPILQWCTLVRQRDYSKHAYSTTVLPLDLCIIMTVLCGGLTIICGQKKFAEKKSIICGQKKICGKKGVLFADKKIICDSEYATLEIYSIDFTFLLATSV